MTYKPTLSWLFFFQSLKKLEKAMKTYQK
jgi:hypothetical protein